MRSATTAKERRVQGLRGFRWTVCALLFVATTINYMDRQILGLLAPTLEKALGWSEIEYSHIVMAFQAAYALGLLVFGRLVDTLGTRQRLRHLDCGVELGGDGTCAGAGRLRFRCGAVRARLR